MMPKLTQSQISSCVETLKLLDPGFLPIEIFGEIARLVRLPIIILIPVKKVESEIQIALVKRGSDEKWWPGMWNFAGTIFRSTDTIDSALNRLLTNELSATTNDSPIFRTWADHVSQRGAEALFIYTITDCIFPNSDNVQWFPIGSLPENLVSSETNVIKKLQEFL